MLAPFIVSTADGRFDCSFHGAQHITTDVADRCAEGVDTIRGGEIVDCLKIVLVEPPGRLKAEAFQQRVGDANGSGGLELHLNPGFIIIHQERAVNDGADVAAVVVPVRTHLRANKARLKVVPQDLFSRLTVLLIHGQKEHGQHDRHHAEGSTGIASGVPQNKEQRHAYDCRCTKTDKLPGGQVNCTPFVRQYDILSNKWGVLLCQKEYQPSDIRQNSKSW